MVRRRLALRSLRFAVTGVLVAAATLVASAVPAQAAPTATITRSGATLVINAAAAPSSIYLGFSTTEFDVPTVTLRLPGNGFASWPDDCEEVPPSGGRPDQYIHCAAITVSALDVTFGPGNDTLAMDGACYPSIAVNLGDGGNTLQSDSNCATVINATSGSGDDQVSFASGGGTATLGAGNDQFRGGAGAETVSGGPGNDALGGAGGNDSLLGEDGNDAIAGGFGNDIESGGGGDDVIGVDDDDQGADDVSGGPGVDALRLDAHTGGGMAVSLDDTANDGIVGEGDNIHADIEDVRGSSFDDTIVGSAASETLNGGFGNDTITGGAGNDAIDADSGDDVIFGGEGNDTIYGGNGNDQITGDAGADNLFGDYATCCLSNGNDQIYAADGVADAINCGGGADTLAADQFDVVGDNGLQACESITRTTVGSPTPQPGTPGGETTLTVKAAAKGKPTRRKGVSVVSTCSTTCAAAVGVAISKKVAKKYGLGNKTLIGLAKGRSAAGGTFTIKVKIKAKARKKLAKAGTIKAVVVLVVADAAGVRQTKRFKIRLKA